MRVTIGLHTFDFVAPVDARGSLADWIADRGPSPYAATVKPSAGKLGALDPTKTHGVRLSFE